MNDDVGRGEGGDGPEYGPSPDHPGWYFWRLKAAARFNNFFGPVLLRTDPDGMARVRLVPHDALSNSHGNVHGGALLGFVDIAMFAAAHQLGVRGMAGGLTIDVQSHFLNAGRIDEPLDARVELLRETGNFCFLRGLLEQDHGSVMSFSGLLKKARDAG